MRTRLRWLALILLPLLWILATPTAAPAAQEERTDDHRTLNVVGEGRVQVAPNIVRVILGVDQFAPSLADARAAAAQRTTAVIDRLVQLGVDRADIQTVRLSISPEYDHRADAMTLRGYRVHNAVSVTLRDVDQSGAIIDQAVEAGADRVDGIVFDTSRREELVDQARAEAMADARRKAEQLARLAGAELGSVVAIEESGAGGPPPRPYAADVAMAESAQTPIEGGMLDVRTTLRVQWELLTAQS